jgi:GT2 family glycosyltransferase
MTGESIWVGSLELASDGLVTGMNGVAPAGQNARILVRMHGAPLGFVTLPASPVSTLTARARATAERTLAGVLQRHADADRAAAEMTGSADWASRVACPRRFSAGARPGISITVCTRDRTGQLRQTLGALREISYDPVEILIVDSAPSTDGTKQLATKLSEEDPRIRYVREERPGLSRARNRGLAEARFNIVAFTDDDTLVDAGWAAAIAAGFAADAEAVCVTGPVPALALDTAPQRYYEARIPCAEAFDPRRYDLVANRHPSPLYPYASGVFGAGANLALRRDFVVGIGGFDAVLGTGGPCRGGEDLDMFLRIVLAGGRICYIPSALVWHREHAGTEDLVSQMYGYGHGLGSYVAKHLANRELRAILIRHGFAHARVLRGRIRHASEVSRVDRTGTRLAMKEALGFVAGAARYWPARRRAARSPRKARQC